MAQLGKWEMRWAKDAHYNLRRAPGVIRELESAAESIASDANAGQLERGYVTGSRQGAPKGSDGRWRTSVVTTTIEAMVDDARNDTLAKLLEGYRI